MQAAWHMLRNPQHSLSHLKPKRPGRSSVPRGTRLFSVMNTQDFNDLLSKVQVGVSPREYNEHARYNVLIRLGQPNGGILRHSSLRTKRINLVLSPASAALCQRAEMQRECLTSCTGKG